MNTKTEHPFDRTISVIGQPAFLRLQNAHVAVFGVGGVGAACAEALARSGVGSITLVDHDRVSITNLNRQLIALHSTLGKLKVEVCAMRLKDINPDINIRALPLFYDEDSRDQIDFTGFDAVADCVDTLSSKVLIAKACIALDLQLLCCLGAGNRTDPMKLRIGDLYETSVCPLARRMRKACREQAIPALRVLYSLEEPVKAMVEARHGRHAPGSVAFVPPVAGMMMAGDIIKHLITPSQSPR
ncbi:MAG: tRNA threonylcarbamoyladenosine dehydratase [Clostridiales bacterium]|nr:tRNA threonylcarbamoyladenosine dehydratase [Clostridiales bacterium]